MIFHFRLLLMVNSNLGRITVLLPHVYEILSRIEIENRHFAYSILIEIIAEEHPWQYHSIYTLRKRTFLGLQFRRWH